MMRFKPPCELYVSDIILYVRDMEQPALSVGIVPMPDFTMLALSAFVDTLRLAADEADRSRPIRCRWRLMSEQGRPVRASNGIEIATDGGFVGDHFDYIVVVGGTLHRGPEIGPAAAAWLRDAAARGVPLIGLCTGAFVLARLDLMKGHRACVSWFHKAELVAEFPQLKVNADALFLVDRDRITCAGGTGVIHLASHLIERHLGPGSASKGLRIMLEAEARGGTSPQPPPTLEGLGTVRDVRVLRAMLAIEQTLATPMDARRVAAVAGVSTRQLARLFQAAVGFSPNAFAGRLRAERARQLVLDSQRTLTDIAMTCGYSDAAHFAREYRRRFGSSPSQERRRPASS
ncbi:transcriptional regulator GlxA family with amidase domain [Sphingomonas jinjuensis]|uniref:Transcriptional regulator GlxA family with amidase domain n=1 Tax=Sphingomonas jinjuensis TaxID=535907 RepID=A0A840FIY1_9SPHN|nr:GlxA family transcriptional regulator [Sphingomonas jinjuensis]MBB4155654.1 transcriptional regulator GlxA family with amidase domain [Sphingomonas jinjuensis]